MKIYRVHNMEFGASAGFDFFTNKKQAQTIAAKYDDPEGGCEANLEEFDFPISKAGMVAALKRLGNHPDNG